MPCYDPITEQDELDKKMLAVLCGMVRKLGYKAVLDAVDWDQAGVSKDAFLKWWENHRQEDHSSEFRDAAKLIEYVDKRLSAVYPFSCGPGWNENIRSELRMNPAFKALVISFLPLPDSFVKVPEWLLYELEKLPPPTEAK